MITQIRKFTMTAGLAVLGAIAAWAQPAVDAARNASSYQNDIAPGSWFVVFGRGMGPATLSVYSGSLPFPTELSGTRVSLTPASGGSAVDARLWYTSAGQLAALAPSSLAAGDYDIRVTYNGQASAPRRVRVVARNFGFATQAQNGQGPAQATHADFSLNRFTTGQLGQFQTRPAHPGDVVVLWGTGLGADAASDVNGGRSGDQTAAGQVRVILGGIEITPAYAGRSDGSPGLDQINFVVPANAPLSCFVPVQVRAGGRLSNQGFLAVAASGQNACTSTSLTPAQLSRLDAGGTLTMGSISLSKLALRMSVPGFGQIDSTTESASASFTRLTVSDVSNTNVLVTQIGDCTVFRRTGSQTELISGATGVALDAGALLRLNGPGASNIAINRDAESKTYSATLYSSGFGGSGQGQPTIAAGTYTVTGTGGADIGAFTASLNVPGNFQWTNQTSLADPISRSNNLQITWSGGGEGLVAITGVAGTMAGGTMQNPVYDAGVFACTAPASAGSFSVPASVLQQLPAVAGTSETAMGMLMVAAIADPSKNQGTFSAPLTAGGAIDWGYFSYYIGSSKTTGWQ